jgi:hypothetical protein
MKEQGHMFALDIHVAKTCHALSAAVFYYSLELFSITLESRNLSLGAEWAKGRGGGGQHAWVSFTVSILCEQRPHRGERRRTVGQEYTAWSKDSSLLLK